MERLPLKSRGDVVAILLRGRFRELVVEVAQRHW
jgi:hypothetical protein